MRATFAPWTRGQAIQPVPVTRATTKLPLIILATQWASSPLRTSSRAWQSRYRLYKKRPAKRRIHVQAAERIHIRIRAGSARTLPDVLLVGQMQVDVCSVELAVVY